MRKIIVQMITTLDGFCAGPNGELDWHEVDDDFHAHSIEMLDRMDTLLFGRVTYEMMVAYWTAPEAARDDAAVTKRMNNLNKYVFSRTLSSADWKNTRVLDKVEPEQVRQWQQQPGKDMAILGSSTLALSFLGAGLVDEVHIIMSPVVLGKGKTLLDGIGERVKLKLQATDVFRSGHVFLKYTPVV